MSDEAEITRALVRDWMANYISQVLNLEVHDGIADEPFSQLGMDSAEVVIMTGVMEEEFGFEIDAELPFASPTINGLVDTLVEQKLLAS
jgi:acyl carrier protein